ncbi:helix-turn-helix domain-containing protein [Salinithrix halophila]|uniref:Gamma-soluble NSF attachment protein n=1 Tax=Salinithrix halophila TaxID=1485204 RepID=A0ABV8JGC7_9BACL
MLSPLELYEIGEVIRKVRKDKGLRLEDLADENISPATISNIERGVPHVNMEKTRYLLHKLDLQLEALPSLMVNEQQELENTKFRLFMIDTLIEIGSPDEALEQLDHLAIDDTHTFSAWGHYLRGKIFRAKKNWKRAERSFFNAIRLSQSSTGKESNIEAAAFVELGFCSYSQNDLDQALRYTDSGIEAFIPHGERQQLYFLLHRNKAIYLEKLSRIGEAMKIVQEVWDRLIEMEQADTVLSFYWLRAELLRRTGIVDEAIIYAKEGLEKARLNKKYDSMFDLWTVLGGIYMQQQEWRKSEACFNMALKLEGTFDSEYKFVTTYARVGVLYIKQNKWTEAHEVLTKAVEIGEKTNTAPRLTYALQIMGDYYRLQQHFEEAIPYYNKALELARKHQYTKKEYQTLFRLSQCYETSDEQAFHRCLRNMYKIQQHLPWEEVQVYEEME